MASSRGSCINTSRRALEVRKLLHLSWRGILFALAKSPVFLAPLLAATILSQAAYGRVEWWLAISLSLGPMANMGAAGVVAYGTIGRKLQRHLRTATIFTLLIAMSLFVFALAVRFFNESWEEASYGLIALQCALICLQTTLSSRLKGLGKGAWASAVESSLYISLLFALLAVEIRLEFFSTYAFTLIFLGSILTTGLIRVTPLPDFSRWLRRNYRSFFDIGFRFMAGSALMGVFMAAPRVLLGIWSTPERVAEFSLAFRWLSVAILIHQFINTMFFRTVFGNIETRKREQLLTFSVSLVGLGAVAAAGFIKIAPQVHSNIPVPEDFGLLVPIGLGIIFWAVTACFEGCLHRLAASAKQTRSVALGCTTLLAISGVCAAIGLDAVYSIAYAWIIGLAAIIGSQYMSLRALGEHFPLLIFFLLISCAISIGSVLLSSF